MGASLVRARVTGWGAYAALFLLVSAVAHISTYVGRTLTSGPLFIALHIGILPVAVALVLRSRPWQRERGGPFGRHYRQLDWREWRPFLPAWASPVVYLLGAYAIANFLFAVVHLPARGTGAVLDDTRAMYLVRMYSGHWMFFYAVPLLFFTYMPRDIASAKATSVTAA